ncbi:hypothetical protein FRC06_004303 [Ceratobasidium sp. 370]|nr:hypothetical protein FRC06_004303 [Ceratobasidium sp. 370]
MSRRKPIPPLYPEDEPLSGAQSPTTDVSRYTLEDPSPSTPETRRFSLHDPSLSDAFPEVMSYSALHRFSEEDRAVLSPISERPERQSSMASSAVKSSGAATPVGRSVPVGGIFGHVMQSVESYPSQSDWNHSAHLQQQQQPQEQPQEQPYPSGYHVPLPTGPSFVSQPTGVPQHSTGFSQPYQHTGTVQSYQHTGAAQSYQHTGVTQSYQHTGFTQSYQHTGASQPQQYQSTGFSYQNTGAGFDAPHQPITPARAAYSTSVYSSPSAIRSRTTPERPNTAYSLHPSPAHAEAYGRYSRASYLAPRSRSASPDSFRGNDSMEYDMVPDATVLKFDLDAAQDNKTAGRTYAGYKEAEGLRFDGRGGIEHVHQTGKDDVYDVSLGDMGRKYGGDSDGEPGEVEALKYHYDEVVHPSDTQHFGPAPEGRMKRRDKTKKRVPLTEGNLVVNLDIPERLVLPKRGSEEMMATRYTAVTCDPDDFEANHFSLRQNLYGRTTELFIAITMYNEDEVLFCRTLRASMTWGPDAWKKVVVCIVADGRKHVHPRVLDCLAALGVYQGDGGHMKNIVDKKEVTAHLFEYTTSVALDPELQFKYPDPAKKGGPGVVPCQILFCMKEKNKKKINSHRWFFNAFGPLLQGIQAKCGACGEIAAYKGKRWKALWNPLVAAQNFEYKTSNILDKPTESIFGYISVLPGAFSAYRYIALQNDENGRGPLASYFKGEVQHGRQQDIFTSNMYLAEDRILCFELIAKRNADWVLRYVKSAVGETDVPDALPEFISQRRRWLNGSFFAAVYSIAHVSQIMQSGHSLTRRIALLAETFYNLIGLVTAWFAIGNFYIFFVILTSSLEDPMFGIPGIKYINLVAQYSYGAITITSFLISMGNKPRAAPWKYKLPAILFAVLAVYLIICGCLCTYKASLSPGGLNGKMLLSLLVTYGVYFMSSLLAFDPWHLFTSAVPYFLLAPLYINMLNTYAFANLDDISWGTKESGNEHLDLGSVQATKDNKVVEVELDETPADKNSSYMDALHRLKIRKPLADRKGGSTAAEKEQAAKDYYASVRTNVLLAWVLSNGMLAAAILSGGNPSSTFTQGMGNHGNGDKTRAYMVFILAFVAIMNIVRFTGSTLYLIMRLFTS